MAYYIPIGRVYKLVSDNGLVYVGSTTQTLSQRLAKHKSSRISSDSSKQLFADGATVVIELLEELCDTSLKELHKLKGKYIRDLCIGKDTAEIIKEYNEADKEKSKEERKEKIICECCKKEITNWHKKRHEKTAKHITNNNIFNITATTVSINNA